MKDGQGRPGQDFRRRDVIGEREQASAVFAADSLGVVPEHRIRDHEEPVVPNGHVDFVGAQERRQATREGVVHEAVARGGLPGYHDAGGRAFAVLHASAGRYVGMEGTMLLLVAKTAGITSVMARLSMNSFRHSKTKNTVEG